MQRRGFLGAILAAGMAPAIVKAQALMPVRAIWTPPSSAIGCLDVIYGYAPLTVSQITLQTLYILERELKFATAINREYVALPGQTIAIRRPQRYLMAA